MASASASGVFLVLALGIPVWRLIFEPFVWMIVFFVVCSGAGRMTIRGSEDSFRIIYGPCSAYQQCLCCGCCCPRARGEAKYESINHVEYVPESQCQDGCGITENRCNSVFAMNLGCCVPSVLVSRKYNAREGCCAFTNLLIGVDTEKQAHELITFLQKKIDSHKDVELGNNGTTIEGSTPANNFQTSYVATAPPAYNQLSE